MQRIVTTAMAGFGIALTSTAYAQSNQLQGFGGQVRIGAGVRF